MRSSKFINTKNKRGKVSFKGIFLSIIGIILLFVIISSGFYYIGYQKAIKEREELKNTNYWEYYWSSVKTWTNDNIIMGQIIPHSKKFALDTLGFNETVFSFFYPKLTTGLLVGLWIHLCYLFIGWTVRVGFLKMLQPFKPNAIAEAKRLQSSWLGFIGSSFWKIFPIGIFYAVIMMIPLVNPFIDTITFKFLEVGEFLRSIILAFYLGLLPGAIEAYSRYRLRMKYYKKLMDIKYGVKNIKAASSG
ncbi:hypothetical protein HYW74_04820 [Candidatus Pacearchaeota archaeon]|nr:hypothetical protein [Candidatus Pacearchaeota archaeon]